MVIYIDLLILIIKTSLWNLYSIPRERRRERKFVEISSIFICNKHIRYDDFMGYKRDISIYNIYSLKILVEISIWIIKKEFLFIFLTLSFCFFFVLFVCKRFRFFFDFTFNLILHSIKTKQKIV